MLKYDYMLQGNAEALLEGDIILAAPKTKNMCGSALTLRYYVDNLSPERRKYSEVN